MQRLLMQECWAGFLPHLPPTSHFGLECQLIHTHTRTHCPSRSLADADGVITRAAALLFLAVWCCKTKKHIPPNAVHFIADADHIPACLRPATRHSDPDARHTRTRTHHTAPTPTPTAHGHGRRRRRRRPPPPSSRPAAPAPAASRPAQPQLPSRPAAQLSHQRPAPSAQPPVAPQPPAAGQQAAAQPAPLATTSQLATH
jgi:hypothetical protein